MRKFIVSFALAGTLVTGFAVASALYAQEPQNQMHGTGGSMMRPGQMPGGQQPTEHGMTQDGMGNEMMCPMMRSGMMHGGMMQGGMMGSETPDSGMMHGGMGALFGSRVRPLMNLSVGDVRGYLTARLERLNNKRLKVGDIKSDDGTITADNSLVQRMRVDRHSGAITYEN